MQDRFGLKSFSARVDLLGGLSETASETQREGILPFVLARILTPSELAVEIWGVRHRHSRSWGSRTIRKAARELYGAQFKHWELSPVQASEIRGLISRRGWHPPA